MRRSRSPPAMPSGRRGRSWHRPAGQREVRSPPSATGALPGRQPPTAAVRPRRRRPPPPPRPLPLQPPATPRVLILSAAGRAARLRSQPSPAAPRGREKATIPPFPSPPCGHWAVSNRATRTAPRFPPQPGGARGPGRKRRRHDVMQTAMGFTAAAAFFWGMGGWGRGRSSCSAVPSPGPPPPAPLPAQCSWCRSPAGSSPADPRPTRHGPHPATRPARRWGRGPGETSPFRRRASAACRGRRGGAAAGGRGAGAPTRQAPGERGRKRRKRKGRSSAAIPRSAAGGRPQPQARSPRGDTGGKSCGLPPPPPPSRGASFPLPPQHTHKRTHTLLSGESPAPPTRPSLAPQRASSQPPRQPGHPAPRSVELPTMARRRRARRRLQELRDHERRRRRLLLPPPRRGSEKCWGCEPAPHRYIYVGLYPSAGAGSFFSPPRRGMCEGDCGEQPCPLRGPAPPPAGPLSPSPSPPLLPSPATARLQRRGRRPPARCGSWACACGGLQPSHALPLPSSSPLPLSPSPVSSPPEVRATQGQAGDLPPHPVQREALLPGRRGCSPPRAARSPPSHTHTGQSPGGEGRVAPAVAIFRRALVPAEPAGGRPGRRGKSCPPPGCLTAGTSAGPHRSRVEAFPHGLLLSP